jgi:hypothetical protein
VNEPVVRPGFRVVAEIPPGSTILAVDYFPTPRWIVSHPDFAPYYLLADGTRREIETRPAT